VTGTISGGWEFVWSAYALAFVVYATYTTFVLARWRRAHRGDREARQGR
jgi:hypothetical protein